MKPHLEPWLYKSKCLPGVSFSSRRYESNCNIYMYIFELMCWAEVLTVTSYFLRIPFRIGMITKLGIKHKACFLSHWQLSSFVKDPRCAKFTLLENPALWQHPTFSLYNYWTNHMTLSSIQEILPSTAESFRIIKYVINIIFNLDWLGLVQKSKFEPGSRLGSKLHEISVKWDLRTELNLGWEVIWNFKLYPVGPIWIKH